jgi:hypothetical protein
MELSSGSRADVATGILPQAAGQHSGASLRDVPEVLRDAPREVESRNRDGDEGALTRLTRRWADENTRAAGALVLLEPQNRAGLVREHGNRQRAACLSGTGGPPKHGFLRFHFIRRKPLARWLAS